MAADSDDGDVSAVDEDTTVDLTPPAPEPREYVGPGVVVGLAAWVVGYVVTLGVGYLVSWLGALSVTGTDATLGVGVRLFLDAHAAPLALLDAALGPNLLLEAGLAGRLAAVVPAVAVGLGALVAVNRVGVPGPVEGLQAGAALALGYLPATLVAVVAVASADPAVVAGTTTAYPLVPGEAAVVVAGAVYPAVVGGVVGALSSL